MIKEIISNTYVVFVFVLFFSIIAFRAVYAYYGFEISNSIWGPLMDKYPFAIGLIAFLLIGWKITELCAKGDAAINKDEQKEKDK